MKQVVKFELYGVNHEMEMQDFTDLCTELCKAVTSRNESWKAFCEKNLKIITVEAA